VRGREFGEREREKEKWKKKYIDILIYRQRERVSEREGWE
jgi:hypothetical protein